MSAGAEQIARETRALQLARVVADDCRAFLSAHDRRATTYHSLTLNEQESLRRLHRSLDALGPEWR